MEHGIRHRNEQREYRPMTRPPSVNSSGRSSVSRSREDQPDQDSRENAVFRRLHAEAAVVHEVREAEGGEQFDHRIAPVRSRCRSAGSGRAAAR